MRKPTPLRWIEEREARKVTAEALLELPAPPYKPCANSGWAASLRRWLAAVATPARQPWSVTGSGPEPGWGAELCPVRNPASEALREPADEVVK